MPCTEAFSRRVPILPGWLSRWRSCPVRRTWRLQQLPTNRKMPRGWIAGLVGLLSVGLALGAGVPEGNPDTLLARAKKLAQEVILVDTHIDAPYRLTRSDEDLRVRTQK